MLNWLMSRLNIWVWLGGLLGAVLLTILFSVVIMYLVPPATVEESIPLQVTSLALNTATPTPQTRIATQTPQAAQENNQISEKGYVQIIGTGNVGLNIRSGPGVGYAKKFLGLEGEVFQVIGGPVESDGYIWWHLEAPYDEKRNGWAVESYMKVFEQ